MITHPFTVRASECDAYGHLNNVAYLRYVLDTLAIHQPAVATWQLIGEEMDYRLQVQFGAMVTVALSLDTPTVDTTLCQFTCQMPDGQIAATGILTFSSAAHPAAITPVWSEAALLLPETTAIPPNAFQTERQVVWQHMNLDHTLRTPWYLFFLQDVAMELSIAYGWTAARMAEFDFGIIVKRRQLQLFAQAKVDDTLQIQTWFTNRKRISVIRHFAVVRKADQVQVARASMLYVWINTKTGRPTRVNEHLMHDFARNQVK